MQLNSHSSLPSLVEYLKANNDYWVVSTKTRLIIVASAILIVVVLVIVGAVTKAQTSQTNTQVILNLENGQQYFGMPHVYQGDNDGSPTNSWPVYYGPNNASQYWSHAGISSNQPVLELAPAAPPSGWTSGAMFWSETYSGGVVKITFIGTYTGTVSPTADGFVIYLFLKPTKWSISPQYNYSIPYNSTVGEGWLTYAPAYPSPTGGDVILPQSSTPYIVVQWDPLWQFAGYTQSGATGQWNVYIVSNPSGNNASITPNPSPNLGSGYAGWDGIGTGAFQPNPGDRINITVTYDLSTNTLTGIAIDLNTGQSASFTLSLSGYFTPPSSGNYVFGLGGAGAGGGAKGPYWALLYVVLMGNVKPSPLTTSTTTPATVTVTTTSIVTSTVTSPVTTTVTSTTTFTVTTTSPVTVTTTVFTTSSIIQTVIIALIIIIVVLAAALVAITIRRR
jgi:hypothetical protein